MVGHMSVLEQVDADFSGARRRALLRRMAARLRRDTASGGLHCFDDVKRASRAVGWIQRGMRTVPVGQISGSVGRCSEFDRIFIPVLRFSPPAPRCFPHAQSRNYPSLRFIMG